MNTVFAIALQVAQLILDLSSQLRLQLSWNLIASNHLNSLLSQSIKHVEDLL